MKSLLATILLTVLLTACSSSNWKTAAVASGEAKSGAVSLTTDEKHRLYSAALAASESPLDTINFKLACQKIGVFDQDGEANDKYMTFVSEHVEWSTSKESEEFRRQINTWEKAREYVEKQLRK